MFQAGYILLVSSLATWLTCCIYVKSVSQGSTLKSIFMPDNKTWLYLCPFKTLSIRKTYRKSNWTGRSLKHKIHLALECALLMHPLSSSTWSNNLFQAIFFFFSEFSLPNDFGTPYFEHAFPLVLSVLINHSRWLFTHQGFYCTYSSKRFVVNLSKTLLFKSPCHCLWVCVRVCAYVCVCVCVWRSSE